MPSPVQSPESRFYTYIPVRRLQGHSGNHTEERRVVMIRVAVLTALLLVVSARPRIREDQSENIKKKIDGVPTDELHSLNSPRSERVLGNERLQDIKSRTKTNYSCCIQSACHFHDQCSDLVAKAAWSLYTV